MEAHDIIIAALSYVQEGKAVVICGTDGAELIHGGSAPDRFMHTMNGEFEAVTTAVRAAISQVLQGPQQPLNNN